eukprot:scaffold486_cov79-Cylindrotheca_fusiformis.AAC.4
MAVKPAIYLSKRKGYPCSFPAERLCHISFQRIIIEVFQQRDVREASNIPFQEEKNHNRKNTIEELATSIFLLARWDSDRGVIGHAILAGVCITIPPSAHA